MNIHSAFHTCGLHIYFMCVGSSMLVFFFCSIHGCCSVMNSCHASVLFVLIITVWFPCCSCVLQLLFLHWI